MDLPLKSHMAQFVLVKANPPDEAVETGKPPMPPAPIIQLNHKLRFIDSGRVAA